VHHRFEAPRPCCAVLVTPFKRLVDWLCCRGRGPEAVATTSAPEEGGEGEGSSSSSSSSSEAPSTPLASPRGASLASAPIDVAAVADAAAGASAAAAASSGSGAAGGGGTGAEEGGGGGAIIDVGADPAAKGTAQVNSILHFFCLLFFCLLILLFTAQIATDAEEMWPFLCEARHRFLNLVKYEYWEELHSGKVGEKACMLLLEANARVQDKVATFPTYPRSVADRVNSRLALWPVVEDLMTHPCLRSLDGVLSRVKFVKGLVHMRTFAVYVAFASRVPRPSGFLSASFR